jgi:hypothetical protein
MEKRKFLPVFADLVDRMSIHLLKEVKIPEIKDMIIKEKFDILHDLDLEIKEKDIKLTADLIHAIIVVAQLNNHIWVNESNARRGKKQDLKLLKLTHSLNGVRARAKNKIMNYIGEGDMDKKTDCLAAEFGTWEYKWRK